MNEPRPPVVRRYCVSGQVQGVFFRASARERARELGLSGWVRNLPDGRVEALAAGSVEALAEFESWLTHGPQQARVSGVTSEVCNDVPPPTFEIR